MIKIFTNVSTQKPPGEVNQYNVRVSCLCFILIQCHFFFHTKQKVHNYVTSQISFASRSVWLYLSLPFRLIQNQQTYFVFTAFLFGFFWFTAAYIDFKHDCPFKWTGRNDNHLEEMQNNIFISSTAIQLHWRKANFTTRNRWGGTLQ